jgi:NitT/TauT family transport system permease protein
MSAPNKVQLTSKSNAPSPPIVQEEPILTERSTRGRRRIIVNALRIAVLVVTLGGWQIATTLPIGSAGKTLADPFFFGAPSQIAERAYTWATEGTSIGPLWEQIYVTMEETVLGFLVGVVLGVVFGVLLGRNRLLADVFGPYIKAANSIPRVVLGSIFIIWLGLGLPSKVALAVVLVFFVVFFNAFQGVREVDRFLIANARILGASSRQLSTHVILPSAMTWIIASLHTSFGFALVGAVVGEFLGALKGLGLLIATAQGTFDPNGVFAAMFILAIVALVAEALVTLLENRLLKWRPQTVTDIAGL